MSVTIDPNEFAVRLAIALGRDERQAILNFLASEDLWVASENDNWPGPQPRAPWGPDGREVAP